MGNVHVTGLTVSNNFPIQNAIQASFGGICGFPPNTFPCPDVFVSKVSADGSMFTISTYLGGNNFDNGNGIAVDSAGNTYVTGSADSATFATTSGALQTVHAGQTDGFVSRIVTTLTVASSSLSFGNHAVGTTSAPLRSSCSVSPSSVTMDGTTTEDVTVRVTTTARSMVPPTPLGVLPAYDWLRALRWQTWLFLVPVALVMITTRSRGPEGLSFDPARRHVAWDLATAVLAALLMPGCGGGGGGTTTPPPT